MSHNFYSSEKASEMHRQELLREADRERLLAQLPLQRVDMGRNMVGKLGSLLLWMGARLKQFEQRSPTVLNEHP